MYADILVPIDGTETADRALEAVLPLARRFDATIHLLHVYDLSQVTPGLRDEAREALRDHASGLLADPGEAVEAAGLTAISEVDESVGPVHTAISEYASNAGVDLIAMGTAADTGLATFAVGSTTRRTLRQAEQPILTVGPSARLSDDLDDVLLATDGSVGAATAADHALDLCETFDATLHIVNVVDVTGPWSTLEASDLLVAFEAAGREAVNEVIDRAERRDIDSVQSSVLNGRPSRVITEYARDRAVDLVTMGTHGRSGLDRVLLGSVSEGVIARADVPVLAVKPDE